jgi:CRP-like cAMP-binding protein
VERRPERTGNLILDALDRRTLGELVGEEPIRTLQTHEIVQAANDAIRFVHFPINGMLSVITTLGEGERRIESGTVGREGMSNAHAALGSRHNGAQETVVQVRTEAYVVPVDRLDAAVAADDGLRRALFGFVQAFWSQAAHIAACNALHDVRRRCARWLLQTHDRVRSDYIFLTQEYLAAMLGVERSTVSVAAKALNVEGLIAYSRGRIEILDRERLEAASCECYELMRLAYSRLVPLS